MSMDAAVSAGLTVAGGLAGGLPDREASSPCPASWKPPVATVPANVSLAVHLAALSVHCPTLNAARAWIFAASLVARAWISATSTARSFVGVSADGWLSVSPVVHIAAFCIQ